MRRAQRRSDIQFQGRSLPVCWRLGDLGKSVGEPSLGIDLVEPCGPNQRVHDGGARDAALEPAKSHKFCPGRGRIARSAALLKGIVSATPPFRWRSSPEKVMAGLPGSGRWEHETAAGRPDHSCELELLLAPYDCPVAPRARIRNVAQARWLPKKRWRVMAIIGMDIHRSFAQAAFLQRRADQARAMGRARSRSARQVREDAVDRGRGRHRGHRQQRSRREDLAALRQAGGRGEFADGSRDRLRPSEDRQDRRRHIGQTYFLPEVWVADGETQRQRRQTTERMGVLEQVVRTKGRIHAILHANLTQSTSGHLFGKAGKKWLASLPLPEEEKAIVGRLVDELERNRISSSNST